VKTLLGRQFQRRSQLRPRAKTKKEKGAKNMRSKEILPSRTTRNAGVQRATEYIDY
jgi:hypothetical protein